MGTPPPTDALALLIFHFISHLLGGSLNSVITVIVRVVKNQVVGLL